MGSMPSAGVAGVVAGVVTGVTSFGGVSVTVYLSLAAVHRASATWIGVYLDRVGSERVEHSVS